MTKEIRILPFDEHNQRLLSNVHPPGWKNPKPKKKYHLVVIGAGTAGLVTAAGAAGLGARVALIEKNLLGGDCLNVGCVPSKGVISAARSWEEARRSAREFGGPPVSGDGDFAAAMERMRRLRASISPHDSARRFAEMGIDVFLGEGKFVDKRTIEVDGTHLRFRRAAIATGARPLVPPIPGLKEVNPLTNETIFELTELPKRLLVMGGGPIGAEMAQAFARFGADVTVIDMAPHVLPRDDRDAAAIVQRSMERDGVKMILGAKVTGAQKEGGGVVLTYESSSGESGTAAGDRVLVSVGRAANVNNLNLEAAGVEYDKRGIRVNDRMQSSNGKVFAVGDCASDYKFTHAADAQARLVIQNALFFGRKKASALTIPWATYTSPEVAHVGCFVDELREMDDRVQTITVKLSEVDRAVLEGDTEGFVRIHLKSGSDEILAATVVAPNAGDLIAQLSQAMALDVGLGTLANVIHPYPTEAEAIRKAADQYNRTRLTPLVKRIFGWWFRIFG